MIKQFYFRDYLYRRAQVAHRKWVRQRKAVKRKQRLAQASVPKRLVRLSVSQLWERFSKTGIGVPVSEAKMDIRIEIGKISK